MFYMFIITCCVIGFLPCLAESTGAKEYAQTLHQTMWATFLHHDKQYVPAEDWYTALTKNSASIYSLKGYILFLFDRQRYTEIVAYVPTIKEHFAHDVDVQRIAAHALALSGRVQDADAYFIALYKQFPTNADIALETIKALVRVNNTQEAVEITQSIINKTPYKASVFIFYFVQAQLQVKLGNVQQARESLQQCINMRPDFAQGWLLMSLFEAQVGNVVSATQHYHSFVQLSGTRDANLENHLLMLAQKQSMPQSGIAKPLLLNKTPSLEKALAFYKDRQFSKALAAVDHCIHHEEETFLPKILKIQILLDMHDADTALVNLLAWIQEEPEQQMWFSLMHILTDVHLPQRTIIEALESIHKTAPQTLWAPLYCADLYIRAGDNAHGLVSYAKALKLATDPLLKTELYFSIALIQYQQANFEAVADAVEQGLAQNSVHAPLFNLAAYYYATKGKDLKKAQHYIRLALAQEPANFHYIDTQALILYKLRAFDKAEALLDQLYAQIPTDSAVILNLAKTKYKLGKKDEAFTLINAARTTLQHEYETKIIARLEKKWQIP
jgi:predicted Zn-dependent protease